MISLENIELEPPDHPCERCHHLSPQLFFDEDNRLLLCPRCMEREQQERARSCYCDMERA